MPPPTGPCTDGSKTWSPSHLFDDSRLAEERWATVRRHLEADEFKAAITTAFELPAGDAFTYHASASVNLSQVEAAIRAGRANGLHAWYLEPAADADAETPTTAHAGDGGEEEKISDHPPGQPSLRISGYPPAGDVQAYISLFDPTKSAANSLKSLMANAKKDSLRSTIAQHLLSKRHLDPSITVSKIKASKPGPNPGSPASHGVGPSASPGHHNPGLDFWAYTCGALEYAGPNANTAQVKSAHHMLPVLMHHFGCVVPSHEAVQVVAKLAGGRAVLDMGSGNGYWTLMLRRAAGLAVVDAVDSGQSRWRTTWIPDTVAADGVHYLRTRRGCPDHLLLLVYPVVGGELTRRLLDAYTGDVVVVAGTQNGNGYTGFTDMMVDEYMAKERPHWEKVCQVPLPSYPGKDDALFAFRRKRPVG